MPKRQLAVIPIRPDLRDALTERNHATDLAVAPEPDMPAVHSCIGWQSGLPCRRLRHSYGRTPAQIAESQAMIRERGASMGFVFGARTRVYNTFDAHRPLHWAGIKGRQLMLKLALLRAYHTDGKDPGKRDMLVEAAESAGLDVVEARKVLESDDYADEVHAEEREYQGMGIQSVPSVIFNNRYLVTGGQPLWKPSSKPSGKFLPKRSPRRGD